MPITDLPVLSALRTKMQWHQERQRLLSENVTNSDTPGFRPRDLAPPQMPSGGSGSIAMARTSSSHGTFAGSAAGGGGTPGLSASQQRFEFARQRPSEVRPGGNAVDLEDEMMKVASNQMDYQAAATLYTKSLGLIKTALGKK